MAIWYKTYAALKDHPKVLVFANEIGATNEIEGLGYLHLFFSVICAYSEDGGVDKIPVPVIEKMCRWAGEPGKFVKALEKSGFIDSTEYGKVVHDWWEINGHQVREHNRWEKARKLRGQGADNSENQRVTDRQTDKQTDRLSSMRDSIDEAMNKFVALRGAQSAYKGISYDPGDRGRRAATNLICGPKPPSKEEYDHAATNFFNSDAGITTSHHAAHAFFENFYSYLSGPLNRAGAGKRQDHAGNGPNRGKGSGIHISSKAGAGTGGGRPGKGHGPAID